MQWSMWNDKENKTKHRMCFLLGLCTFFIFVHLHSLLRIKYFHNDFVWWAGLTEFLVACQEAVGVLLLNKLIVALFCAIIGQFWADVTIVLGTLHNFSGISESGKVAVPHTVSRRQNFLSHLLLGGCTNEFSLGSWRIGYCFLNWARQ